MNFLGKGKKWGKGIKQQIYQKIFFNIFFSFKVGSDVVEFKENDLIVPAISGIGTWCSHGIYDSKELFLVEGDVKDFIFLSILKVFLEF